MDIDASPVPTAAEATVAPPAPEQRAEDIRLALLAAARAVNADLRERELRRLAQRREAARTVSPAASTIGRQ